MIFEYIREPRLQDLTGEPKFQNLVDGLQRPIVIVMIGLAVLWMAASVAWKRRRASRPRPIVRTSRRAVQAVYMYRPSDGDVA